MGGWGDSVLQILYERGTSKMNSSLLSTFNEEYLGLNEACNCDGIRLCQCQYRDMPLNKKYFYPVIAAICQGMNVISCSPKLGGTQQRHLCDSIDFEGFHAGLLPGHCVLPDCEPVYMDRMFLAERCMNSCEYGAKLDCPDETDGKAACCDKNHQIEYRYLDEYRKYIALMNGDVIGYCKVSDVIAGYGNFVVFVDEAHRRKGIAQRLVRSMIQTCLENKITPMYLVRITNLASLSLAKKAGFQVLQRELVFCHRII